MDKIRKREFTGSPFILLLRVRIRDPYRCDLLD